MLLSYFSVTSLVPVRKLMELVVRRSVNIDIFNSGTALHRLTASQCPSLTYMIAAHGVSDLLWRSNSSLKALFLLSPSFNIYSFPGEAFHFWILPLLFNYVHLWNKHLTADIFLKPPLYVWRHWKELCSSPFELYPISAGGNLQRVRQIVNPNNCLHDFDEVHYHALADSSGN